MLRLVWYLLISCWTCSLAPGAAPPLTVTLLFDLGPGAADTYAGNGKVSGAGLSVVASSGGFAQQRQRRLDILV